MPSHPPTVFLLDDEPEMVKALTRLLRAKRFEVRGFTSVRAFLDACRPEDTACLVLDVAMPGLDGLELQRRLAHQGILDPHHFSHRPRRHSHERARDQGRRDGFLDQARDAAALVQAVRAALETAEPGGGQ